MLRALVTGCAGFIGSQLSESLIDGGWAVRGVDNFTDFYDPRIKRLNLTEAKRSARFELVEADLAGEKIEPLLDGVDVVFHLAGQPGVRVSWSDGFQTYVTNNILVTQRLLEGIRNQSVERIVYASSSSVYGNAARYPVTEEDLPRPHSPYGVTKLAAEHLCTLYAENWRLPAVSLRYFSVYGPRQRPDMGFARFFAAAQAGTALPIYGTGDQVRDFTYVADVVSATVAAATADIPPGTVCNIAGGSSASVNQLIRMMAEITALPLTTAHLPAVPGDVERTGGAIELAKKILDWEPTTGLREGITAQFRSLSW